MGRVLIAPIVRAMVVGALVIMLAACRGTPAPAASVLDGQAQATTLAQVKQAIDGLYNRHPSINTFVVRNVTYTPETRDKVLKICSEGGLTASAQELEAQKVMACAPLIFFYYNYGQQNSVVESIDVARQLYWYAVTDKSPDAKKLLTELLRGWGIP